MSSGICAFTGHRAIKAEHSRALPPLVLRAIEYAYSRGCRTFLAGGAVGFDTVAARQVILFRMSHPDVKMHLLLPCKNQDEKWSERQRQSYQYTLSLADEVHYISEEYTRDCMKKRNQALVADADLVISYVSHSESGAAQTVRMAMRAGKEVYNLYPTLEKTVSESSI